MPRSQSWWPLLRLRAPHPQTHGHLLAWRLGFPWCQALRTDGRREDSSGPRPCCDLSLSAWPGSWSAGGVGEEGTSGPSCAQATPTHSAPLPPSRLLRAWASLCLWRRERRGQRETGVEGGGGRPGRETAGLPASARLPPGLRFAGPLAAALSTKQDPGPPALCVPGSGDPGHPGPWRTGPRWPISRSARLGDPESLGSRPPTPHAVAPNGSGQGPPLPLRSGGGEPLMDRMSL